MKLAGTNNLAKNMDTSARAVLITGCSSGIGLCLAEGLHALGYRVFATARKAEDLALLSQRGFETLELDLTSPPSIHAAADEVLRRTSGRLYALINNAGYGQPGAVEDLTRTTLQAQFETNVFGTQELTNRLLPAMRNAREGRIIQISSLLGIVCLPYRGAYSASKFALEALSDTMRLELHGTGIRVILIQPGPIDTRFRSNSHSAYRQRVDADTSRHRANYAHVEARLSGAQPLSYALPPQAVLNQVIRALEARNPRARYTVTIPAAIFGILRRLLPTFLLDKLLRRIGGGGRR
jgi:NAD(P)-dependent dehydrogenase (short-subunit alcohol dehydrogenase family)